MKRLLTVALTLIGIAWPFAVYFSLGRGVSIVWLLLPLTLLWLLRALAAPAAVSPAAGANPGVARLSSRVLPLVVVVFCVSLLVMDALGRGDSQHGLRLYPVLINAMLLCTFGLSLKVGPPVIERIARLRFPDLPPEGVRYTRKVTQVWCGFFALNGAIAAALAFWGPWHWWTLYNGAISYALMGALMLGEWSLRPKATQRV